MEKCAQISQDVTASNICETQSSHTGSSDVIKLVQFGSKRLRDMTARQRSIIDPLHALGKSRKFTTKEAGSQSTVSSQSLMFDQNVAEDAPAKRPPWPSADIKGIRFKSLQTSRKSGIRRRKSLNNQHIQMHLGDGLQLLGSLGKETFESGPMEQMSQLGQGEEGLDCLVIRCSKVQVF